MSLHCRALSRAPYSKSKVAKVSPHFYNVFIACSLIRTLHVLSKSPEFSSDISGWSRSIRLGEMKCDIAGFEIASHTQETKCSSCCLLFKGLADSTYQVLHSFNYYKEDRKKIFFLVVSYGKSGLGIFCFLKKFLRNSYHVLNLEASHS